MPGSILLTAGMAVAFYQLATALDIRRKHSFVAQMLILPSSIAFTLEACL